MKKKTLVNKLSGIFLLFISSFAFAGGVTPFTDLDPVSQIPNSALVAPATSNLTAFTSADISTLVTSMRNTAQTCDDINNAIGLQSGLATRKDGIWTAKMIKNAEGLSGAVTIGNMKEYNVAWFPDDKKGNPAVPLQSSVRFTTGRLKIGSMPFLGRAHLEIPIANIKKETIAGANNQNFTRYWFKAVVTGDDTTGYTSNLPVATNYFKVLGTQVPILDFLGYYDDTGEWKIKIVINSKEQIVLPEDQYPLPHPPLDLEIYSEGTALQSPYHDCINNPGQ